MQIAMVIALYCMIFILSSEQRTEFKNFISDLHRTYKQRKRIKGAIRTYEYFYENANTDYLRGFYYGRIGNLKSELNEVKYFGKEW